MSAFLIEVNTLSELRNFTPKQRVFSSNTLKHPKKKQPPFGSCFCDPSKSVTLGVCQRQRLANLPLHLDGQLQFPLGIDLGGANVRMAENGVRRLNAQRLLNFART
jgi:hypothetical protein